MRKKTGAIDLTTGNEMRAIVVFALPLIAGNLFQQLYNLMDTMIVGKFIGADALAAVGSSYMTMDFVWGAGLYFPGFTAQDREKSWNKVCFSLFCLFWRLL